MPKGQYIRTLEHRQKLAFAMKGRMPYNTGTKMSNDFKLKCRLAKIGNTYHKGKYKKEPLSYNGYHAWLRRNYNKIKCENSKCLGKYKRLDWALIKGRTHQRNRKNYKVLCSLCHFMYDEQWKHLHGLKNK